MQSSLSNPSPIVSVLLITYNQKDYIAQAIESVLMQKTDFPFEVLIGDDCSTDGTSAIVGSYADAHPDQIRLVGSEHNVGGIANERRLMEQAQGKYLAFLEGDDFWTDDRKLQKQVEFLEANPEYGLVHGDVNHLYEDSGKLIGAFNKTTGVHIPDGWIFSKLMAPAHLIKTMTVCFRKDIVDRNFNYNTVIERGWLLTDLPLWLVISRHSKVHYIDEVLATYRLRTESASQSAFPEKKLRFYRSVFDMFDFYTDKYNCDKETLMAIDEYRFTTFLRFSLLLSDAAILAPLTLKIKSGRRPGVKPLFMYRLIKTPALFNAASWLYRKLKA